MPYDPEAALENHDEARQKLLDNLEQDFSSELETIVYDLIPDTTEADEVYQQLQDPSSTPSYHGDSADAVSGCRILLRSAEASDSIHIGDLNGPEKCADGGSTAVTASYDSMDEYLGL